MHSLLTNGLEAAYLGCVQGVKVRKITTECWLHPSCDFFLACENECRAVISHDAS